MRCCQRHIMEGVMFYIYEFDIAAVCLISALLILLFIRRNYPSVTNRLYVGMLCTNLFATVIDLITVYSLAHTDTVPLWVNYVVNMIYLISFNACAVLYHVYTVTLTKESNISKLDRLIGIGVLAVDVLLIATTPFTKLIIYFDEDYNYCHGPLMPMLYINALLLIVYCMYLAVTCRKKLTKYQYISVFSFNLLLITAIILQFFFPQMLLQGFACALFLVVVYVSLQNPDDYMDKATNCYNSTAFHETLEFHLSKTDAFSIVALTMDDFQYINRILGVKVGNEMIDSISLSLQKEFGTKNVYHLLGCRYAVVTTRTDQAQSIAEKAKQMFSASFELNGMDVQLTPCVCIVNHPDFAENAEDISNAIDYTLKAVSMSSDKAILTASADSLKAKDRENQITHVMKQAILQNGFDVYYQPLYSTEDHKFTSAEALVRLIDKDLGFIPPDEFIPIAERNGMIRDIGNIVFRKVCEFLNDSDVLEHSVDYVEVNLSVVQCMQESLSEDLIGIMDEYSISPETINFEITETAHSANDATLRNTMETLIEAGSTFSMDDYGTGFSTANYLITLPMEIVKIDKSILWPAMKDENALTVLKHTVSMLKSLNKKIVVEGVEDENMVSMLTDMGVDYLQGYYYSRPVPSDKYYEFVCANN